MEFGEQIKNVRTENGLTQEQMAQRLNITRQSVSNWENNRNLPDIEKLILISKEFCLSLDELILGGEVNMNNMTEKLIKDTSEERRAKFNLVSICIGTALIVFGALMILLKALSVEYIDASGVLHENFFLLPISFCCLFGGFAVFAVMGVKNAVGYLKNKKSSAIYIALASLCVVLLLVGGFLVLLEGNSGIHTAIFGEILFACAMAGLIICIIAGNIKRKN